MDLKNYNQSWFHRGRSVVVVLIWYFIQHTLFKFPIHNLYNYRNFLLRIFGCKIGKGVKIRRTCEITYPWKVKIGDYTWIDDEVILYSLDNITIGKNCSISRRSFVCTGSHNVNDKKFSLIVKPVVVNDATWIQAECFIGQGITIGKNCVVLARSSVFKDLPQNMICKGIPCIPYKERIYYE